ncbi:metallophosphoesterase [Pseudoalteromonas sp. T1lg75]|uniref:metallophosphoesterase n=1 Tax=Pseudoalteromonas sp. T1lg75 TaxID=2077102 RepID=UPI000CF5F6A8|nr:metallophosphoesterase [Pseudoalteromonas sp. T1lg75]
MTWFKEHLISAAKPLHFGHFTDSHVFADKDGEYFNVNCAEHLAKTLAAMAEEDFDFVVFGGDLTQDHSAESYHLFAELVAASPLACPVFWVPGNHDELTHLERMSQGQISACKRICHPYAHLLLINTKGTTPAGWVSKAHLQDIKQALAVSDAPHILIGHHHPLPVRGYIDKHILENGAQLLDLLNEHSQVKALVHGHAHNEYERVCEGVTIYGTPATSIQFTKHTQDWQQQRVGPAYRRLRVEQDGLLKTQVVWLEN